MERLTNSQFVQELMDCPRSGPLLQVMVLQALDQFSTGVLQAKAGSMGNQMVSEEAWRECAQEIQDKLTQRWLED